MGVGAYVKHYLLTELYICGPCSEFLKILFLNFEKSLKFSILLEMEFPALLF